MKLMDGGEGDSVWSGNLRRIYQDDIVERMLLVKIVGY